MSDDRCPRCAAPLTQEATYTPQGALVCRQCAALEVIAAANARAAPPVVGAPWLRPAFLRRHGVAVSVALGATGLLGAPFAIYAFFALDRLGDAVPVAYAIGMATSLWAGVVGASERRASRLALAGVSGAPATTAGDVVAAAAGPAMVAAGCGVSAIVIAAVLVVALAVFAWLFWLFFMHGPWNVG